jgi:hypothetical protein
LQTAMEAIAATYGREAAADAVGEIEKEYWLWLESCAILTIEKGRWHRGFGTIAQHVV